MNHDYIEAHQIIDRFLMGKLSLEEAEVFQDHTMTCQRCLDDLAMAERMQRGVVRVYQSDAIHTWTPLGRILAWWKRQGFITRGALTMAVMVAIAGPPLLLAWRMQRLQNTLESSRQSIAKLEQQIVENGTQPQVNIPLFRLSPQRGISDNQTANFTIRLHDSTPWLVLILEVDAEASGFLQAKLEDENGKSLWTTADLILDANGEITIGLRANSFQTGDYLLSVLQQNNELLKTRFRVIREP